MRTATPSLRLIGLIGGGYSPQYVHQSKNPLAWLQTKLRRILITPNKRQHHARPFEGLQKRAKHNAVTYIHQIKSLLAKKGNKKTWKKAWSPITLASWLGVSTKPKDSLIDVIERWISKLLKELKEIVHTSCTVRKKNKLRYKNWWRVRKALDQWLPRWLSGRQKGNAYFSRT